MKKFIFSLLVLIAFSELRAQVYGVENYSFSPNKDSMITGGKVFIYPRYANVHKLYWYTERSDDTGVQRVLAEAIRILDLNNSSISDISSVKDAQGRTYEVKPVEELIDDVQNESVDHYYIHYKLKDKYKEVDAGWILEILIDKREIHFYINSTYMSEQVEHLEFLQSLR